MNSYISKRSKQQKQGQQQQKPYRTRTGSMGVPHHVYHLVDPSPWPALTAFCLLFQAIGAVLFFHGYSGAGSLLFFAFCLITYVVTLWWRDVVREGSLSFHTSKVQNGQSLGIILFIVSEAAFFQGLLWAFMHVALMPTVDIGIIWPPLGILPFNWTGLPLRNTFILQGSFFTANRAKHAFDCSDMKKCGHFQLLTIGLRVLFINCQYIEYTSAAFTFSDTVFGSTFYQTTGFHGFHVLIGRIYLAVCYFLLPSLKSKKFLRFNLAILYWHFVDIVWRRLLILLYVWGSSLPTNNIEACKDPFCELSILLSDRLQSQVLSIRKTPKPKVFLLHFFLRKKKGYFVVLFQYSIFFI